MSDEEEEDYEDEGYEDEEDEEDYYEDVQLIPGAGQAEVDDETADFSARVERLAAWEEQLVAYNGKLAEEGWKSWKKGAVTSVMNELQRKVVPDVWRDEVLTLTLSLSLTQTQTITLTLTLTLTRTLTLARCARPTSACARWARSSRRCASGSAC